MKIGSIQVGNEIRLENIEIDMEDIAEFNAMLSHLQSLAWSQRHPGPR